MCALYQKFHRTREHGGSGAQWGPRNVCKDFLAVEAKRINEAVRNNPDKFPADYMFALTADESAILRSKFSSLEHGGKGRHSKYNYKAFTEKGLYMLATVLKKMTK